MIAKNLWVVLRDSSNPQHVHSSPYPHLLTGCPGPGDTIVATIKGHWRDENDDGRIDCAAFVLDGRIMAHGECEQDHASCDVGYRLIREHLRGAEWTYAPCQWEPGPTRVIACERQVTGWQLSEDRALESES